MQKICSNWWKKAPHQKITKLYGKTRDLVAEEQREVEPEALPTFKCTYNFVNFNNLCTILPKMIYICIISNKNGLFNIFVVFTVKNPTFSTQILCFFVILGPLC